MKKFRLADMPHGWFVGNFEPTVYKTSACEVAIKRYTAGDAEKAHVHYEVDELTAIVSGSVKMNGVIFGPGDIVSIAKGESCDFYCCEDAVTVVFKSASVQGDKKVVARAFSH